ncbi:transketolase [uncultured Methanoregula sp.]|uniref:transketolase n=1 Tax=uncultured Methanoregula sp. TaxID=1005933 RepID=UPI002AAB4F2F|nr:transketolase [uncultured Methanoregula sp.]
MRSTNDISDLEEKARTIRKSVVNMIFEAGTGHPGGSLSCVDIITVLYFHQMHHNPADPKWIDRDIFVLSKGHAAPTLYATLAECGYFSAGELLSLRKLDSLLQGHPEITIPGVEVSTGSLGQGLSISCGIALSAKIDNKKSRVYTLLGDGECNEGQIWEAAILASHYKLDNLTAIVDRNGLQIDGPTEKVMSLEPIAGKWKEFGWHVIEIDGNKIAEILESFETAKRIKGKPTVIIAHTLKGKGVSFMEWVCAFHGKTLNKDEMKVALNELEGE